MTNTHARATTWLFLLPVLAAGLASGCKDKAKEMSQYPYYVEMLDSRWDTFRKELRKDAPNFDLIIAMRIDLDYACETMASSYHESNREAAIAKLQEVRDRFYAEMDAKTMSMAGKVSLLPGVTPADLKATLEKSYAHYQEFRPMLALKKK